MEEIETNESEITEQDRIPPEDLSDEDLHSVFDEGEPLEEDAGEDEDAESDSEEEEATEPPEEDKSVRPDPTAKVDRLEQEVVSLKGLIEKQSRFIDRRNTEFGDVRKQLQQRNEQLKSVLREKGYDDPDIARQLNKAIDQTEAELENVTQEEALQTFRARNEQFISQHVKSDEVEFPELVDCLKRDGASSQYIEKFVQDPFGIATGPELLQLQRRARAEKALRIIFPEFQKLTEKLKKLEKKPDDVLRKIERASREIPRQTAKARGVQHKPSRTIPKPELATDEELERLLQGK